MGSSGMFYLSGLDAEVAAAALRSYGLQAEVLGERPGQASAFKMGYAGFTKGTTALLLELALIAQAWGCLDALLAKYASSHPETFRMFTTHVTTWPEYAAIRAEEMVELAAMAPGRRRKDPRRWHILDPRIPGSAICAQSGVDRTPGSQSLWQVVTSRMLKPMPLYNRWS
jgi:hypothetical protein